MSRFPGPSPEAFAEWIAENASDEVILRGVAANLRKKGRPSALLAARLERIADRIGDPVALEPQE